MLKKKIPSLPDSFKRAHFFLGEGVNAQTLTLLPGNCSVETLWKRQLVAKATVGCSLICDLGLIIFFCLSGSGATRTILMYISPEFRFLRADLPHADQTQLCLSSLLRICGVAGRSEVINTVNCL